MDYSGRSLNMGKPPNVKKPPTKRRRSGSMLRNVTLLWIFGLVTIVPAGLHHLFFTATRDEYAFLITIVLFWIFGFWGVVGPLLSAYKVRQVFKAIELAADGNELKRILQSGDAEEDAIDLIATENHLPKFLARKVFRYAVRRFSEAKEAREKG